VLLTRITRGSSLKRGQRVTSRDVAELAGVSRTTVSFVLNEVQDVHISQETRQRVLEAARQLNYYPNAAARSLASRQAGAIGLILCQSPEHIIADPFLPGLILGLGEAVRENGFHLLIQAVEDVTRPDAYVDLVHTRRIDGVIISGPRSDDQQLSRLLEDGFPVVLHGRLDGEETYCVDVDNVKGALLAVRHLIGLGYRRIALITNAPLQYTASADRHQGYRMAMQEASLPYDESLVRCAHFTAESGYQAMNQLLTAGPAPEAIFVASDLVAMGAILALRRRGMNVPQDMALVGFDDVPLAGYVDPPLTTVRLPTYDLGWQTGDLLARLVRGDPPARKAVLLETELVIRESCGAGLLST
jgi:DNA-binding LacI/PurR family transcriptional regulator